MALDKYVGSIILEVDGTDADCIDCKVDTSTGKKPVKTMNRKLRIKGYANGIVTYNLSLTVVIPAGSESIDWENLEGAKVTIDPGTSGGVRKTYTDCTTVSCSAQYNVDNEARRDLQLFAADMTTS